MTTLYWHGLPRGHSADAAYVVYIADSIVYWGTMLAQFMWDIL